jgi:hypothetical protein
LVGCGWGTVWEEQRLACARVAASSAAKGSHGGGGEQGGAEQAGEGGLKQSFSAWSQGEGGEGEGKQRLSGRWQKRRRRMRRGEANDEGPEKLSAVGIWRRWGNAVARNRFMTGFGCSGFLEVEALLCSIFDTGEGMAGKQSEKSFCS